MSDPLHGLLVSPEGYDLVVDELIKIINADFKAAYKRYLDDTSTKMVDGNPSDTVTGFLASSDNDA